MLISLNAQYVLSVWFSNEDKLHTTLSSPFLTTVLISVTLALKLVCVHYEVYYTP